MKPSHRSVDTSRLPATTSITPGIVIVLALLSALAPFATDLYLPAFPTMSIDLGTDATAIQLTLTAFLIGVALGQLAFGPISDRFGRRWPLIIGAAICIAASVITALAPTISILISARFVQGFSGAAGMVIGRAVITDISTGKAAARAFSVMMMVGGIAPILAPFVGSLLIGPIGWRGLLWVVAVLAAVMLIAILVVLKETHPSKRRQQAHGSDQKSRGSLKALASRAYIANTLVFSFSFAVLMAYISASPFVYQIMIGMDPVTYGIAFGVTALGVLVVSAISAKLASTHPIRGLLGVGTTLVFAGTIALLVMVLTGAPAWTLTIPIFIAVSSLGLILGNATALALGSTPTAAGLGSAVLGALQFGLGAMVSPLVSIGGEDSAVALAAVMVSASTIALLAFVVARPSSKDPLHGSRG